MKKEFKQNLQAYDWLKRCATEREGEKERERERERERKKFDKDCY